MCGIAGVLELDRRRRPSRESLHRMAKVLAHRGPDEEGFYESGPVGFAHRRLSIIDLASGQQPMESADGAVCVVFNGEIYNYPELKVELEQQEHVQVMNRRRQLIRVQLICIVAAAVLLAVVAFASLRP